MMNAAAHTPGPWMAASGPSSIVGWPVVAQTGRLICSIATPPKNIDRIGKAADAYNEFISECGANAHLIAAAPHMLEALNNILSQDVFHIAVNDVDVSLERAKQLIVEIYEIARIAAAKAEGR